MNGKEKQVNTVNEIKHIILPKNLREMTACAFRYVQDGKTIYVPSELKQNVIDLAQIRWKSIKISKDNKWFKVNNKCILSKSGNKVCGYWYRGMNYDDNKLKVEFLSAIPPKGLDWFPESVISVPKGGKERYEKAFLNCRRGMKL